MRPFRVLFPALVAGQAAHWRLAGSRHEAVTRGIAGLMLLAAAGEAAAARGAARGPALVGSTGAVRFAGEVVGGRTAGGPLLAAAASATMARPAWVVGGLITRRRAARAALAGGALAARDVFLETGDRASAKSFLGRLVAGTGAFAPWALADAGDDPPFDGDGPVALYVSTCAAEAVANAVLWRRPRVAAAGAAAMSAFAVPALLRRRARRRAGWLPA